MPEATINTIGKSDVMGRDGFTWWIGEVEKIDDPQQLGRVKVRVIGWYTGGKSKEAYVSTMPTEDLPWALCLGPTDQPGIKNTGTKTELQVGAQVLGFFLDGEEAQMPVIMGSMRSFKNTADAQTGETGADTDQPATVVADGKEAPELPAQSKDGAGADVHGGAPFNTTGEAPADNAGGSASDRGIISKAERELPGNYATNPKIVPTEAQGIANGSAGPAGEGFERDLNRMLTEVGNFSSALAKDPAGNLISIITGKKVDNKILDKAMKGINNFIANGISGIMSWMKEVLAKQIEAIISQITQWLSNVIPMGVINAVLALAEFIFSLFCGFEGKWIFSLVKQAFNDTAAFAENMAGIIVSKVYDAIPTGVLDTVNSIVGKVKGALNKVMEVANVLVSAISTIKNLAGKLKDMANKIQSIFQFDFSKISWSNIVSLILALLKMLIPKKDCGRKIKPPKQKFWLPLWGTSTCDTVPEFFEREITIDSGSSGTGNSVTGSDVISSMYNNLSPFKMEVQSFMNGASVIQDNNPGKEKTITSGTGGQTTIDDNQGNTHRNQPNNLTQIIGGDYCTTAKGDGVLTVEGDLKIHVMGDLDLEVGGSFNQHQSNGVGEDNDKQSKSAQTIAADHEINYQGNWGIQASNITMNAISNLDLNAGSISTKATSLMNSISGEIVNECAWETNLVNNVVFNMVAMLNPIPGVTGRLSILKGPDITLVGEGIPGTSILPAAHVRMAVSAAQPCGVVDVITGSTGGKATVVTTAAGGIGEFVTAAGGAIVNAVTSGTIAYSVGAGIASFGCGVGPTQIYGLPLMLN